jgi:predicted enzyme related to lactoylglutathione lyase
MAAKKKAKKGAAKAAARRPAPKKKVTAKKASAARAAKATPPVVHWEIQARDAKKLHGFYADLFGWTINANNPMNYGMVASKGKGGIDGGIGGTPPGGQNRVLVYTAVPDINVTLKKAESLGGKTLMPRTDLGMVILATFEDPEGNHFGIIEG